MLYFLTSALPPASAHWVNSEAEVTGTNLTRIITSGVFFSVGQKLCLLPLGHGGPEHGQIGLGELLFGFCDYYYDRELCYMFFFKISLLKIETLCSNSKYYFCNSIWVFFHLFKNHKIMYTQLKAPLPLLGLLNDWQCVHTSYNFVYIFFKVLLLPFT